ncbi:MAG: methenyltetrahydromethanopterin cyclohydrolase [Candidatus Odinarchaeia archaeon]
MADTLISVNYNSAKLVEKLVDDVDSLGLKVFNVGGARVIDSGIDTIGSVKAGILISEICMGGLARINIIEKKEFENLKFITVSTNEPVISCLGSQYAGWSVKIDEFSALGSGPARALSDVEKDLFNKIGYVDNSDRGIIIFETRKIPSLKVVNYICSHCHIRPENLTIIIAPTASLVGMIQVTARVLETAMHRLYKMDFELRKTVKGFGTCPIPPIISDDGLAMGLTNDAIITMGEVTLNIKDLNKTDLNNFFSKVPSVNSPDFGKPFIEKLKEVEYEFYKIDPNLFSPARLNVIDEKNGQTYSFGRLNWQLYESFLKTYGVSF